MWRHSWRMESWRYQLRLRLKKKFQTVCEGVPKQGNPAFLEKIYTELCITEGGAGEVNIEHEVTQIEMASKKRVTTWETPIRCTDIFKPLPGQDKPIRTMLTKGLAGIGKTVSVQKFILDWTEGKANEKIQLIFPLPFRELNLIKHKTYNFVDIIHHFFSETKGVNFSNHNYNIAFIFDGLDESRLPLDFQHNESIYNVNEHATVDVLLTNLIKGNLLPSALVWITSRPAAANQIPPECVDQVTEVRGFTDPQKEEYFRKRITEEELANRIITHLKCTQIFREEAGLYQGTFFCFVHLSIQEFLAALYVFLHFAMRERSMLDQHQTSQLHSLFSANSLYELHQSA
ncbi:protein NLRC3-like [Alosa alosa]|uniref:protein NLRC3-like n=1 Tax=Alosa alosa TaxID=278164 RepID=UPI00201525C3|nr:protein NLRC3-like [Alosa alosa]